jgi:hypothetical protein
MMIRPYVAAAAASSCQQQKQNHVEYFSKIEVTEPDLDEDEIEMFDQCVIEERGKGSSKSRARRICEDFIMEEREGSLSGRANVARRKFLGIGILPKTNPGVFTILQR